MLNNSPYKSVEAIKQELIKSLKDLEINNNCALLNYPNYNNIGDHLIGLGTVFYLLEERKVNINYLASIKNFSSTEMENKVSLGTILLQGGGNLGDLWYEHQQFREDIISKYQQNPIIILPQTIYFKSQGSLNKAKKVFNAHPNLTICVRDNYSYKIAQEHFNKCRLVLVPDMAFYLTHIFNSKTFKATENELIEKPYLFFKRKDKELNFSFHKQDFNNKQFVIQDWVSYKQKWFLEDIVEEHIERKYNAKLTGILSSSVRILSKIYRETIQRMLFSPQEYLTRQTWLKDSSASQLLNSLATESYPYKLSLSMSYSGAYQLSKYQGIITTRLHGHILCCLLGIPNLLTANSYHKNEQFYETWTKDLPQTKFVHNMDEVKQSFLFN